jgi:hypothetical protein
MEDGAGPGPGAGGPYYLGWTGSWQPLVVYTHHQLMTILEQPGVACATISGEASACCGAASGAIALLLWQLGQAYDNYMLTWETQLHSGCTCCVYSWQLHRLLPVTVRAFEEAPC